MKQRTVWILILILPMVLLFTYAAVSGEPDVDAVGVLEPQAGTVGGLDEACTYVKRDPDDPAPEPGEEEQKFIFASKIPEAGYLFREDGITNRESEFADPENALGPPTGNDPIKAFSLGNIFKDSEEDKKFVWDDPRDCEGYIIVEFTELFIEDRAGPDLCVYEAGTNVANGETEPVRVYVSPNDKNWYYFGETDRKHTTAIDLDGKVPKDTLFPYVAICDKPDTLTSGGPGPGPDIDAVGGLNWSSEETLKERLAANAKTEGVKLGGEPVATNEVAPLPELTEETLEVEEEAEVDVLSLCGATITELVRLVGVARNAGDDAEAELIIRTLRGVLEVCSEDDQAPASAAEGRSLEFELASGGMQFESLTADMFLNVETAVAYVSSTGRARFEVVLNAQGDQATVTVQRGPVTIWPFDPDLSKIVLPSGATVVVTEDSISDPVIKASAYMPMVRK